MSAAHLDADGPKLAAADDRLGVAPHAAQLATAIRANLRSADEPRASGLVVAVEGPWGAGKSTYVNFVRENLRAHVENGEFVIVDFDPWWLGDKQNLFVSFLKALATALPENKRDGVAKALALLARTSRHIPDWLIDLTTKDSGEVNMLGRFLKGTKESAGSLDNWFSRGISPREARDRAAKAILASKMGLLVVIDDLDRLEGKDALEVFRFVKSVGDLPGVIYLLAFDPTELSSGLMSAGIAKPTEFLEKIIQSSVRLPDVARWRMRQLIVERLSALLDIPIETLANESRVDEVICRLVKKPRDLSRLINNTAIVLEKVRPDIDLVDFVCVQAVRALVPALYDAIRREKELLTDAFTDGLSDDIISLMNDRDGHKVRQRKRLLVEGADVGVEIAKRNERILRAMFPKCAVWAEGITGDDLRALDHNRSIAISDYFDTYFSLELSPGIMSRSEIERVLSWKDPQVLIGNLRAIRESTDGDETLAHFMKGVARHPDKEVAQRSALALYRYSAEYFPRSGAEVWQLGTKVAFLIGRLVHGDDAFSKGLIEATFNAAALYTSGPLAWLIARTEGDLGAQSDQEMLDEVFNGLFTAVQMKEFKTAFCSAMATQGMHADIFQVPGTPRVLAAWHAWSPAAMTEWARNVVQSNAGMVRFLKGYAGFQFGPEVLETFFEGEKDFESRLSSLEGSADEEVRSYIQSVRAIGRRGAWRERAS